MIRPLFREITKYHYHTLQTFLYCQGCVWDEQTSAWVYGGLPFRPTPGRLAVSSPLTRMAGLV